MKHSEAMLRTSAHLTEQDFSAAPFQCGVGKNCKCTRIIRGHGECKAWEMLSVFQQSYLGLMAHLRTILQLDALPHFLSIFYIKHE